jgi:hypothetical protein
MNGNTVDKIYNLMRARDNLRSACEQLKEAGMHWSDFGMLHTRFALSDANLQLVELMRSNWDEYMEAMKRNEVPF